MDAYTGEIRIFGGNYAPQDWAFCNGQLLNVQQNAVLFSIIGIQYGGDGRTTFGLPNLQGQVPLGAGTGPGLFTYTVGDKGGSATYTLDGTTMPQHTHSLNGTAAPNSAATPVNAFVGNASGRGAISKFATDTAAIQQNAMDPLTVGVAGSPTPLVVSNMQPYLPLNFIICLYGNYPVRPS